MNLSFFFSPPPVIITAVVLSLSLSVRWANWTSVNNIKFRQTGGLHLCLPPLPVRLIFTWRPLVLISVWPDTLLWVHVSTYCIPNRLNLGYFGGTGRGGGVKEKKKVSSSAAILQWLAERSIDAVNEKMCSRGKTGRITTCRSWWEIYKQFQEKQQDFLFSWHRGWPYPWKVNRRSEASFIYSQSCSLFVFGCFFFLPFPPPTLLCSAPLGLT